MPQRASSPACSEVEFDISHALADDDLLSDGPSLNATQSSKPSSKISSANLDINDILGGRSLGSTNDNDGNDDDDDDEGFIAARQAAHNRKGKAKGVKKGGGFQVMGLNHNLLKAITRKGFSVPTPIQRKTIPLLLEGLDVVGMARTGSGKTAAFVIPMIERLKVHSSKIGARAIILSPSRELALQTLKVVKELGKGTDLRCVLLVGGDSLEDQFGFMAENPDIIIATPGRFLHLQVEMELDLSSVEYVVFDEADRLFEMGFASQLTEILHALPANRQTLLFSATLPKALTEFAKAGLQEPRLVRLDAETKVSQDLEMAFFSISSSEKEAALIHILKDVIKIPPGQSHKPVIEQEVEKKGKKRKRGVVPSTKEAPSSHSTIIFTATKHHVEYLARLISLSGYTVSYVYGSLDQVARRNQIFRFRSGETKILVVTDVAARGIDIPVLANVINYDFPSQPKVFIHRVGRTARAGQRGWAYSLVRAEDAPYLLDLQLFLGRKIVLARDGGGGSASDYNFTQDVVCGALRRDEVEREAEAINKLLTEDSDLSSLRGVAAKGEKQYNRSRPSASRESAKRAKELVVRKGWLAIHPLFADSMDNLETEKERMLARVNSFRPPETIFEIGQRGLKRSDAAVMMKARREKIKINPEKRARAVGVKDGNSDSESDTAPTPGNHDDSEAGANSEVDMSSASDSDLACTFAHTPNPQRKRKQRNGPSGFEDTEHFMSYAPSTSLAEDRGYSITTFAGAARNATLDLTNDDGGKGFAAAHKAGMRWDKRSKKYVSRTNDEDGSRGRKMVVGESGQKIAASFKSGRFEQWKRDNRISRLPRTGEVEAKVEGKRVGKVLMGRRGVRMFHKSLRAPKMPDKARDDYKVRRKRYEEAKEKGLVKGAIRNELRGTADILKSRRLKEKRREKNARPSKKRRL